MDPFHRHFLLIGPCAAKLPLCARQDRARISIYEELWYRAGREPLRVSSDDLYHIGGLSLDGDFTGPPQCWATRLTRFQVWPTISCHLFLTETADHAGWQNTLDKDILLQNDLFAGRRAHGPKNRASLFGPLLPG